MTAYSSLCLQLGSDAAAQSKANTDPTTQVIPITSIQELASIRQEGGFPPATLERIDFIVSSADLASLYNPMELANWVPFLLSDATVSVKVLGAAAANLQPVNTSFLLAGLASSSERKEADGSRVLTAQRKASSTVTAAPLKKKNPAVVTLSLDDGDDDDMIDEDALLSEGNDLLAPPPAMGERTAGDDCSGREPCADCSCGRADASKKSSETKQADKSSCGKCSLGDAFRCASCPYLGKPAFKPGEEHLILDLADDL
jgi:hypothetical protein